MKWLNGTLAAVAALSLMGLVAVGCEDDAGVETTVPGPAADADRPARVDVDRESPAEQSMQQAGRNLEDAAENTGDAVQAGARDAGNAMERGANRTGAAMEETGRDLQDKTAPATRPTTVPATPNAD